MFDLNSKGEVIHQEVLAISSPTDDNEPFKPVKMNKADFIMA